MGRARDGDFGSGLAHHMGVEQRRLSNTGTPSSTLQTGHDGLLKSTGSQTGRRQQSRNQSWAQLHKQTTTDTAELQYINYRRLCRTQATQSCLEPPQDSKTTLLAPQASLCRTTGLWRRYTESTVCRDLPCSRRPLGNGLKRTCFAQAVGDGTTLVSCLPPSVSVGTPPLKSAHLLPSLLQSSPRRLIDNSEERILCGSRPVVYSTVTPKTLIKNDHSGLKVHVGTTFPCGWTTGWMTCSPLAPQNRHRDGVERRCLPLASQTWRDCC